MPFSSVRFRVILPGLLIASSGMLSVTASASSANATDVNEHISSNSQCGAISPRLLVMGDNYYDLAAHYQDADEVDVTERLSQDELLSALHSKQYNSGQGHRTECFGYGTVLQPRTTAVELQDIVSRIQGTYQQGHDGDEGRQLIFDFREYDEDGETSTPEFFVLPHSAIATETFSGLLISSHQRQRQVTPQGAYLRETQLTALQTEHELILQQRQYVNGTLAQWSTWQLDQHNPSSSVSR